MSVETNSVLAARLEQLDALYAGVIWPVHEAQNAVATHAAPYRQRIISEGGVKFVSGTRTMLPVAQARFDAIVAKLVKPVVIEAGATPELVTRLEAAFAEAGPEGSVVVRVRWPWDALFYATVTELGLKVIGYHREVEHSLTPSLHVLDGGADLVVLSGAVPPREGATAAGYVPPYAWIDFDGLDAAKLADRPLERLAERVAELLQVEPELSDVQSGEDHAVLAWYAPNAFGFVAELAPSMQHLLVSYVPYDDRIDQAVIAAGFELFAKEDSRARPRRTDSTPDRPVFA